MLQEIHIDRIHGIFIDEDQLHIFDETVIKVGYELIWIWVAIEPYNKGILGFSISTERNMFVAKEKFIAGLIQIYDKHSVSTDGGTWHLQHVSF
jgi:transposase-like protein